MTKANSDKLWVRCGAPNLVEVAQDLRDRLLSEADPVEVVITSSSTPLRQPEGDRALAQFLSEQAPSALLWLGGALEEGTLSKCLGNSIATGIAEVSVEDLHSLQRRSLLKRRRLDRVSFVMTRNDATSTILQRAGIPTGRMETADRLVPDLKVLPYSEDERRILAGEIGTRPTWLAAGARLTDIATLVQAHNEAKRAAHRMLLTVVASEPTEEMATAFEEEGLSVALESHGDLPTDETSVFLATSMDELGLFFRLATICFICGTFDDGATVDPYGAAALGSAILAGTRHGLYADKFTQLSSEGAVHSLAGPQNLGQGIIQLLSVERAAKQAHAGWQVATSGFETLDRLETLTRNHLLRFEN